MNYCGLEFKGRAHDGLNDARATADLYRAVHDKESTPSGRLRTAKHWELTPITCIGPQKGSGR